MELVFRCTSYKSARKYKNCDGMASSEKDSLVPSDYTNSWEVLPRNAELLDTEPWLPNGGLPVSLEVIQRRRVD